MAKLLELVSAESAIPADWIQPSTEVMELGIDSLDFVELIFEIEEVFDIEISTELNREFNTKTAVNSSGYFKDAANMLGLRDLTIVYITERPTTHFSIA